MPVFALAPAAATAFWGSVGAGAAAGAGIYGARKNSQSADKAVKYQTQSANYAADLEAKASDRALAFATEQEAQRRREHEQTQARNYEIYMREDARKQPFRDFSVGALAGLSKPIYAPGTRPPGGSIGALMKG